jgi:hypothetical protein
MFSKSLRFVLIGVSAAYGLYYLTQGRWLGYLYLFAGALLIYGYFRYGPVFIAFRHVQRKNFERAASLLAQVRDPDLLSLSQRAYFEFASAAVAEHQGNDTTAERHLRAALEHQFRSENDRALTETVLAQVLLKRDAPTPEARDLLERARHRPCKPELKRTIEEVLNSLPEE